MSIEQNIIHHYIRLRSPFRVADKLGLDIKEVLDVINAHPELSRPRPSTAFVERHGGMGREELRGFIVSRRRTWDRAWDNTIPSVAEARRRYEAGTHDMRTARDGDWLILYSVPQAKITPRKDYFSVTHAI